MSLRDETVERERVIKEKRKNIEREKKEGKEGRKDKKI
jgi:hypothetical protein